jgi:hypothetical protein
MLGFFARVELEHFYQRLSHNYCYCSLKKDWVKNNSILYVAIKERDKDLESTKKQKGRLLCTSHRTPVRDLATRRKER